LGSATRPLPMAATATAVPICTIGLVKRKFLLN
jgi:hypothetical protein